MALKTIRYIDKTQKGGVNPETGEEYGDRAVRYFEWHPDLEKLMRENHKTLFCCVEKVVDDKTMQEVKTVHCVHYIGPRAKRFLKDGISGGEGIAASIEAHVNSRIVQSPDAVKEIQEMRSLLQEAKEVMTAREAEVKELRAQLAKVSKSKPPKATQEK